MRSVILLLPLALSIAACDRQSQPAPQANAADGAAKAAPEAAAKPEEQGTFDLANKGKSAPANSFEGPDGAKISLQDFRGGPVLVNLWATWCAPCVQEMPTLDALAAKTRGKLTVLTVSQDIKGSDVVDPWFEKRSFAMLKPYLDPDNKLGMNYGAGLLPTTVLYDAEGKEVWRLIGVMDWNSPRAHEMIAPVLG